MAGRAGRLSDQSTFEKFMPDFILISFIIFFIQIVIAFVVVIETYSDCDRRELSQSPPLSSHPKAFGMIAFLLFFFFVQMKQRFIATAKILINEALSMT